MSRYFYTVILILVCSISFENLNAQSVTLGETIIFCISDLKKGVDPDALREFINREVSSQWSTVYTGTELYILQADRGIKSNDLLIVCAENTEMNQNPSFPVGSPFSDKVFSSLGSLSSKPSAFIRDPEKYTSFRLIGPETIGSLSKVEILGIHYIQVRKDKADEFERFVKEKLYPRLSGLLPDMGLFYYKAVDGENNGSYITIFAIRSVEARERFWPAGGGETKIVKEAFLPLNDLAHELGDYLVEGSFLLPESGGAAAYFESLRWTDFVIMK